MTVLAIVLLTVVAVQTERGGDLPTLRGVGRDLEAERELMELRDAMADRDEQRLRCLKGGRKP